MKSFVFSLFDKLMNDGLCFFFSFVVSCLLLEEFKDVVVCDLEVMFNMCFVVFEELLQ